MFIKIVVVLLLLIVAASLLSGRTPRARRHAGAAMRPLVLRMAVSLLIVAALLVAWHLSGHAI